MAACPVERVAKLPTQPPASDDPPDRPGRETGHADHLGGRLDHRSGARTVEQRAIANRRGSIEGRRRVLGRWRDELLPLRGVLATLLLDPLPGLGERPDRDRRRTGREGPIEMPGQLGGVTIADGPLHGDHLGHPRTHERARSVEMPEPLRRRPARARRQDYEPGSMRPVHQHIGQPRRRHAHRVAVQVLELQLPGPAMGRDVNHMKRLGGEPLAQRVEGGGALVDEDHSRSPESCALDGLEDPVELSRRIEVICRRRDDHQHP